MGLAALVPAPKFLVTIHDEIGYTVDIWGLPDLFPILLDAAGVDDVHVTTDDGGSYRAQRLPDDFDGTLADAVALTTEPTR